MTPGNAPSPVLSRSEDHGDSRLTKGKFVSDPALLVRGVNIMAGTAGPPLFLMYMQPVEINIAIPEVRRCLCSLLHNHGLLVTEQAQAVLPPVIGRVKFMGKCQPEDEGIVRAVGIMAGSAVSLHHGSVLKASLLPHTAFFMTPVADFICPFREESPEFRKVRRMAGSAVPLFRRFVLLRVMMYFLLFQLMAGKAESIRRHFHAVPVAPGMGIMTAGASCINQRLVNVFLYHTGNHIIMTGDAEIGSCLSQSGLDV